MASPLIIIEVQGETPSSPGEAQSFPYTKITSSNVLVTVRLLSTAGVTSFYWELVSKPLTSTAVFNDPTIASPTFYATQDVAGTYLIRCTINSGQSMGTNAVAFRTEHKDLRKFAESETVEYGVAGWTTALNELVDALESGLTGAYSFEGSLVLDIDGVTVTLDGDEVSPGNSQYYGTNGSGDKGFYDFPSAGVVNLSDVNMPLGTGSPTHMDTADEWFNQSHSVSPVGGFDITAFVEDVTPGTFLLSLGAGNVTVRASEDDPFSAMTVIGVSAVTELELTDVVNYVYVESGVVTHSTSFLTIDDRRYALLYVVSISDVGGNYVALVSDMRYAHVDTPNVINSALKYMHGGLIGKYSSPVVITTATDVIEVKNGHLYNGTKRYAIDGFAPSVGDFQYCYFDGVDSLTYSSVSAIPRKYDDESGTPSDIPEGKWANLWIFAVGGAEYLESDIPGETDSARVVGVLGTEIYDTAREAAREYEPQIAMAPYEGYEGIHNSSGNIFPIARVSIYYVGGSADTFVIKHFGVMSLEEYPKPEIKDIPSRVSLLTNYATKVITVDDRNTEFGFIKGANTATAITLPTAASFGVNYWIKITSIGVFENGPLTSFVISRSSTDTIGWVSILNATALAARRSGSSIYLISNGVNAWFAADYTGKWEDSAGTVLNFDGFEASTTEDNVVVFDEFGNISDSGVAIGDLGGGGTPVSSVKSDDYQVLSTDPNNTVFILDASDDKTITLEAAPATDRYLIFKNYCDHTLTIDGNGLYIDDSTTLLLGIYESVALLHEGGRWSIL